MTEQENSTNNHYPSVRQMSRYIRKLGIKSGDILALRYKTDNANVEMIDLIDKALNALKIDALIIVVNDFDDLTVLNETEMNKRGWYRFKTLTKMMKLPEGEVKQ